MKSINHHNNRRGFILYIAVAMLPLLGIALAMLSSDTRLLAGRTTIAKRQAYKSNLLASCTQWVTLNRNELLKQPEGYTKHLDTAAFDLKHTTCTVTIDKRTDTHTHVTIKAFHSGDQRFWRHSLELTSE